MRSVLEAYFETLPFSTLCLILVTVMVLSLLIPHIFSRMKYARDKKKLADLEIAFFLKEIDAKEFIRQAILARITDWMEVSRLVNLPVVSVRGIAREELEKLIAERR